MAGTGDPLLSIDPGIVWAPELISGITVMPGIYPEIHVGVDCTML